jgi:hypothetical protein
MESALQPLIGKLLSSNNTSELYLEQIWNALPDNIAGRLNPQNQDEFWSNEYGPIYRNTFSQKIVDAFGAVRKRKNNGIVLIFDEEKIKGLKILYEQEVQGKAKAIDAAPNVFKEPTESEGKNILEHDSEGSESSEGFRVCGFIIE